MLWLFLSFELDDIEALNFLKGRVLELTPMQVTYLRQLAGLYAALAGEQKASSEITLLAALILAEFRRINSLGKVTKPATEEITPDRRLIQDVARFAHRHSTETIHIPDVAKAVGISESYLRARFHALAGIGLGTYIRRLQLHRARAMMFASGLRLSEIAERCGYDSIYTFSRTFRREMGMSPSHYRLQGNRNRSQR